MIYKVFLNISFSRRIFINNQYFFKGGLKIADKDLKIKYSSVLYYNGHFSGIISREDYHKIRYSEGPQKHVENYGSGVFEGIRAFWHEGAQELRVLGLKEHVDRLFDSMTYAGLVEDKSIIRINAEEFEKKYGVKLSKFDESKVNYFNKNKKWIAEKILELISQSVELGVINPRNGCYIRPKVHRGMNWLEDGSPSPYAEVFSLYHDVVFEAFVHEWGKYVEIPKVRVFERGVRNADRKHKCISNYLVGSVAKNAAKENGFDEALLVDSSEERNILEGGGENILIKDSKGILWTPFIDNQDILDGITLRIGLEIAKNFNFNVKYKRIPLNYLMEDGVSAMFYGTATGNELIDFIYDPLTRKLRNLNLEDKTLLDLKREYDDLTGGGPVNRVNNYLLDNLFTSVPLEKKVLSASFT